MRSMVIPSLLIVFSVSVADECQRWSGSLNNHLSTKTPYRLVANKNLDKLDFSNCQPKKFWAMIRHGTRFPGIKLIKGVHEILVPLREEIIENYERHESKLCEDAVESFRKWTPGELRFDKDKQLAHEGEDELLEMGERFQERFPELFPTAYSSKYEFKTSDKQRALVSLKYFMIGIFGRSTVQSIWPLEEDPIDMQVARFYKLCPRWRKEVKKNPSTLEERDQLLETEKYSNMLKNVTIRLGLDTTLNATTVALMYTLCGFETSWEKGRLSPWCSIFTQPELSLLELAQDLKYYHIDGYGHPLNYQQACPTVQHLLNHFKSEGGPTTSLLFSHSGTILKLLARFGVYNDTEWRTSHAQDRLWRTSRIDAFASNLAFVLYGCETEEKFLFLHQERAIQLPGCPAEGLCPLRVLLERHRETMDSCEFSKMCAVDESS